MNWVAKYAVVLAAALLGGCATYAPDAMPEATAMPVSLAQAPAPPGFVAFCLRFAGQCTSPADAPATIVLTDQVWRSLQRINRQVNNDIWPQDDERHYGRAEYWTIPTDGYGDCDDYAVTKRKTLIDAGFPAPALRLAVVYSPTAGRHAVLTIATDRGDLVLDNLRNDIVSWNATGFLWIERQDASNPFKWVALQPVNHGNVATAGTPPADQGQTPSGATAGLTRMVDGSDLVLRPHD